MHIRKAPGDEFWIYVLTAFGYDIPRASLRKIGPFPSKKKVRERVSGLPPYMHDITTDVPDHVGLTNVKGLKRWFLEEYLPDTKHFVIVTMRKAFSEHEVEMCLKAGAECRVEHKDGRAWDNLGQRIAREIRMKLPVACPKCTNGVLRGQPCRGCLGTAVLPPQHRRQK